MVQIDHTKVDIMLVDDVTRACIGRPWLTLVLDVHTRMVLGLYLSLDAQSAISAALAVAQAVLPKTEWLTDRAIKLAWPAHGLPEVIHVDNGREFHSRSFERGCQQHGIRLEYRPPATPRFGGHIERLMGTLMGRVHALPGSTSSSVAARGGYDPKAERCSRSGSSNASWPWRYWVLTITKFTRHWVGPRPRSGRRARGYGTT